MSKRGRELPVSFQGLTQGQEAGACEPPSPAVAQPAVIHPSVHLIALWAASSLEHGVLLYLMGIQPLVPAAGWDLLLLCPQHIC